MRGLENVHNVDKIEAVFFEVRQPLFFVPFKPHIEYKVYDDYSILAMVKRGLGVSILYNMVISGFEQGLVIKPVQEPLERPLALAWKNWETLPLAARRFAEFILHHASEVLPELDI